MKGEVILNTCGLLSTFTRTPSLIRNSASLISVSFVITSTPRDSYEPKLESIMFVTLKLIKASIVMF
jgi:hypothetical protein